MPWNIKANCAKNGILMKALLDTNILIDYLNGVKEAKVEIEQYQQPAISIITWMEVMIGSKADEKAQILSFLDQFDLINIDRDIATIAVEIRKGHSIKLPDAIIWASAQNLDALLVTRNIKVFPVDSPGVRLPYRLD